MTTSGGFDAGELHIDGAPASSHRAPHGWVWRFKLCALSPDRRRWLRFELDVAGGYHHAALFAKCVCIWRGGRRPLVLGVKRLRAASRAREQRPVLDARF